MKPSGCPFSDLLKSGLDSFSMLDLENTCFGVTFSESVASWLLGNGSAAVLLVKPNFLAKLQFLDIVPIIALALFKNLLFYSSFSSIICTLCMFGDLDLCSMLYSLFFPNLRGSKVSWWPFSSAILPRETLPLLKLWDILFLLRIDFRGSILASTVLT